MTSTQTGPVFFESYCFHVTPTPVMGYTAQEMRSAELYWSGAASSDLYPELCSGEVDPQRIARIGRQWFRDGWQRGQASRECRFPLSRFELELNSKLGGQGHLVAKVNFLNATWEIY